MHEAQDDFTAQRERMVMEQIEGRGFREKAVLDALRTVPREAFVPDDLKTSAFINGPLPIGYGQTISQPYIVALMTDLLAIEPHHRVLEIGTGSGYQTAILSQLCKQVYTMETIIALSEQAVERFAQLHYSNIEATTGNGYHGWPEHAPYDGIIVTAAATHIPDALVEQLEPGGRLVIPVGVSHWSQKLLVVTRDAQGETTMDGILDVAFVPLVNSPRKSSKGTD